MSLYQLTMYIYCIYVCVPIKDLKAAVSSDSQRYGQRQVTFCERNLVTVIYGSVFICIIIVCLGVLEGEIALHAFWFEMG